MKVLIFSENKKYIEEVKSILELSTDMQCLTTMSYKNCVSQLDGLSCEDIFVVDCAKENFGSLNELRFLIAVNQRVTVLPIFPDAEYSELDFLLPHEISFAIKRSNMRQALSTAIQFIATQHLFYFRRRRENFCAEENMFEMIRNSSITSILSVRHQQIVVAVLGGLSNGQIANNLHITEATVKAHLTKIFKTLNISNRGQLFNCLAKNSEGRLAI